MRYHEIYFYTATIKDWKPLIKKYNQYDVILQSLSYLNNKNCIKVYGFVVMPNHIHLVWEMLQPNGKETPVSSFMKFTAHVFEQNLRKNNRDELKHYAVNSKNRKYNFWQPEPDQFLLYKAETIAQKLNYMHNNPLQDHWQLVNDSLEYPYSSARFYELGESNFDFLHDYRDWQG